VLRNSGAGTIFGQGGQDRERQSREREIKVFAGIRAFFVPKRNVFKKKVYAGLEASSCPEMKRSPKKVFPGFGRISVPKMAQDTSLKGRAKVAQGGRPAAPLLPSPILRNKK